MKCYSLTHLSDQTLLRDLAVLVVKDRVTTASMLAHLAEVDSRRLYLPAAHPSMYSYCVYELRLSEDAAYKRIQAARVARQFPVILEAVADGRLHLTGLGLLAPHLTAENVVGLLAAAAHKTKAEVEAMLAQRFPRSEGLALLETWPAGAQANELGAPEGVERGGSQLAPAQVGTQGQARDEAFRQLAPAQVGPRSRVAPIATERFLLPLTMSRATQDKLQYAKELLGHSLPSGDLAQVVDRALDALIEKLEKQKFAATARPRRAPHPESSNPRHIPAHVKRAVWKRDRGQCSFVSEAGHRCPARKPLEFDHAQPVARGGQTTVGNIRLRCRAHNLYAAECTFGAEFMRHKREVVKRHAAAPRPKTEARAEGAAEEVITPLRMLGFRADEARRAVALCEDIPEASLEDRVRRALSYFHRPRTSALATNSPAVP